IIRPLPGSPLFPYTTLFRSKLFGIHAVERGNDVAWKSGNAEDVEPELGANLFENVGWTASEEVLQPRMRVGLFQDELDDVRGRRSEEHTSELQSLTNLVCRL